MKTIGPFAFSPVELFAGDFYVHIQVNGDYWDSRKFQTAEQAEAFLADPLAGERPQVTENKEEIDTRFLDPVAIRDIYRRVA